MRTVDPLFDGVGAAERARWRSDPPAKKSKRVQLAVRLQPLDRLGKVND